MQECGAATQPTPVQSRETPLHPENLARKSVTAQFGSRNLPGITTIGGSMADARTKDPGEVGKLAAQRPTASQPGDSGNVRRQREPHSLYCAASGGRQQEPHSPQEYNQGGSLSHTALAEPSPAELPRKMIDRNRRP